MLRASGVFLPDIARVVPRSLRRVRGRMNARGRWQSLPWPHVTPGGRSWLVHHTCGVAFQVSKNIGECGSQSQSHQETESGTQIQWRLKDGVW